MNGKWPEGNRLDTMEHLSCFVRERERERLGEREGGGGE